MNVEDIKRLVAKGGRGANPWSQPMLGRLIDKFYPHINTCLNYYKFLYYMVAEMKPAVAVEIGVEFGVASAHMCAAAHAYGGKVIGIDKNSLKVCEKEIHQAWPGIYTFIHGDSTQVSDLVEAMVDKHGKIGVLFQDSSHHYAPSCLEWDLYSPLMAEGGVWVCDDVTPAFFEYGVDEKSMVEYFDERPARHKMKYPNVLHYGNTVGVILL